MKTDDLKALGLDEEQIKKVFELNGKDIAAEKRAVEKAEQDRDAWKTRAETAEDALKGFEGVDVKEWETKLEQYKEKAEKAEKEAQEQILKRDQRDYLKTEFDRLGIASERTRKSLAADIMGEDGLKWKNGAFMGLSDYLNAENEKDHFFLTEEEKKQKEAEEKKAKFTEPKKEEVTEPKDEPKPVPKIW